MDALQRDKTALLRELHEVEQTITSDAFVYVSLCLYVHRCFRSGPQHPPSPKSPPSTRQLKQTLNDLKDVLGMDEAFLQQQIERLKVGGRLIATIVSCVCASRVKLGV